MPRKKQNQKLNITPEELKLAEFIEKQASLLSSIKVNIKPKNDNQKLYWKALRDTNKSIVIGSGAPGTGKSYLSQAYALKALKENEFEEIRILVPTCEASGGLSLGFLPGTVEDKTTVYKEASMYTMTKILEKSEVINAKSIVKNLVDSRKISFELMSYIRGKTFDNTLILVEEAENLSPEELLLVMTRIGENSKLVISGDPRQSDRKYSSMESGLEHAVEKLKNFDEVSVTEFTEDDIVRNSLISKILKNW
jgi:phosphate starvation-inducible PhoH-like protein